MPSPAACPFDACRFFQKKLQAVFTYRVDYVCTAGQEYRKKWFGFSRTVHFSLVF